MSLGSCIRAKLQLRKLRKRIMTASAPQQQPYQMAAESMFFGSGIWHDVKSFPLQDSCVTDTPIAWLKDLVVAAEIGISEMPITRLDGLAANASDYGSLREFALRNFRHDYTGVNRIGFATDDDFETNIGYFNREIPQPAPVTWCEWNNRFFLQNPGRGHHTAAIFRQCLDQAREFRFRARLQTLRINTAVISRLKPYKLIICSQRDALRIFDWSSCLAPGAPWLPDNFPHSSGPNNDGASMIYLDRSSPLALLVDEWLVQTDGSYLDFSAIINAYNPEAIDATAAAILNGANPFK